MMQVLAHFGIKFLMILSMILQRKLVMMFMIFVLVKLLWLFFLTSPLGLVGKGMLLERNMFAPHGVMTFFEPYGL